MIYYWYKYRLPIDICHLLNLLKERAVLPLVVPKPIDNGPSHWVLPPGHWRLKLKICRLCHANIMCKFDAEIKSYKFNWIATPSPNCVGNPGWHRTRKPLAYRVSCYTHSPHLNIPRSFKIVIYLILERIYTSSINTFPWQSIPFIYRSLRKCILSYV